MSFKDDQPNYKEYDQSTGQYYYDVPHSAWSELESLIEEAGGADNECLYLVLSKIATKARAGHVDSLFVLQQIPGVVSSVRNCVKNGRFQVFMDCLAILHDYGEMNVDSINEYLEENHIGYIAENDSWTNKVVWLKNEDDSDSGVESNTTRELGKDKKDMVMLEKKTDHSSTVLFITHSNYDKEYVVLLTKLLRQLKIPNSNIVCTSDYRHKIPNGESAYVWLKKIFNTTSIHMIFVLSENYYNSVPCLNEMGAAWLVANRSDLLLLPGFGFDLLKKKDGCLDKDIQGVMVDGEDLDFKAWLNNLRDDLVKEFSLEPPNDLDWETYRDEFIKQIRLVKPKLHRENKRDKYDAVIGMDDVGNIPVDSAFLLVYAANSDGIIYKYEVDNTPTIVAVNGCTFMTEKSHRESARWVEALNRLLSWGWVVASGDNEQCFELTGTGYSKADWLKDGMNINTENDPLDEIKGFYD